MPQSQARQQVVEVQQQGQQKSLAPQRRELRKCGPCASLEARQHKLLQLLLAPPARSQAAQLYSAAATTVFVSALGTPPGELFLAKAEVSCWA